MKTLKNYHPAVLMIYFIAVIGIAMFAVNPIIQLTAMTGGVCSCLVLTKNQEFLESSGFYVFMFFIVAFTNPIFSHNGVTPLFFMNGNAVTLEAVIYGIGLGITLVGVIIWFKVFSSIMTSDKILYLFGSVIPKLSLIISVALKFIPMFLRQMKKVSRAQTAMGIYSSKGFTARIKSASRVFSAMISWSIETSMDTSASMKARGYGLKGRTDFSIFKFRRRDFTLLSVCSILLAVTIFGIATGETEFNYYPKLSEISFAPSAIAVYISYGCLTFLPFIIEVKEALVWKFYVSKI